MREGSACRLQADYSFQSMFLWGQFITCILHFSFHISIKNVCKNEERERSPSFLSAPRVFPSKVHCPQVGGVAEKDLRTLVDFMYHGELEVMMIELFI